MPRWLNAGVGAFYMRFAARRRAGSRSRQSPGTCSGDQLHPYNGAIGFPSLRCYMFGGRHQCRQRVAVHEDAYHVPSSATRSEEERGSDLHVVRSPGRVYRHASPSSIEDGKAPQRPRHFEGTQR